MYISVSIVVRMTLLAIVLLCTTNLSTSENSKFIGYPTTGNPLILCNRPSVSCTEKCKQNGFAEGSCLRGGNLVGKFCKCKK
ncbi:hypothetical protein GE061_007582 [Apolygus lucorum]|uniref:Invertebrate defensins family profile domain-containing protein n=1 Tax=Apolygus lucorum TaxID=248454 RepID=A0A6A4IZA5_APOLU|nr:hypothetical protein GE061_007582 [Apolygus lucorum]